LKCLTDSTLEHLTMSAILCHIVCLLSFVLARKALSTPAKNLVAVETSNGKLVGRRKGDIVAFLGVPYAEPPIGKYRFRPSVPKRPWYPTERQAFNYSAECLQSALFAGESTSNDEDCLYLNIWYPAKPKSVQPLPVMVWIYGGAFLHGSASRPEYSGHKLAARDVIVVSINYRVGALGFLVSIPDSLFGNYGLHDQKLALQWVQDNIYLFNGDPTHVTVFGESAGAMSTVLHMLDQHNKPKLLFNAVILQSNPLGYR
jgi:carboxylesterase type B